MPLIYNQNRLLTQKLLNNTKCTKHNRRACREPTCIDRIAERLTEKTIAAETNFNNRWLGGATDARSV